MGLHLDGGHQRLKRQVERRQTAVKEGREKARYRRIHISISRGVILSVTPGSDDASVRPRVSVMDAHRTGNSHTETELAHFWSCGWPGRGIFGSVKLVVAECVPKAVLALSFQRRSTPPGGAGTSSSSRGGGCTKTESERTNSTIQDILPKLTRSDDFPPKHPIPISLSMRARSVQPQFFLFWTLPSRQRDATRIFPILCQEIR